MIPKIIHYCWFGKGKMPKLSKKYIETWKKNLPEYEIIQWDETSFNVSSIDYTKEAYEAKKYAFVSDYVRLYALYNYGGIYFDTDVEVVKPIEKFLSNKAFVSFEDSNIGTAVIGSVKNGELILTFLNYYNNRHFKQLNGLYDDTPNTHVLKRLLEKMGLNVNNKFQNISDVISIYPSEYFSAKSFKSGKYLITENTYCIHHFSCSWLPWYLRLWIKIVYILKFFLNK